MAVLCKDLNLLYICIPKTGSTTMANFLISNCGGNWVPEKHQFNEKGQIVLDKKHCKISDLIKHGYYTEDEIKSLDVFATIRNPFDLVLSNYYFEKQIYQKFYKGIRVRLVFGKRIYFYIRKKFNIDRENHYSWIMPQIDRYQFTVRNTLADYLKRFYSRKKNNVFTEYTKGADAHFLKLENIEKDLDDFFQKRDIKIKTELPLLSKTHLKKGHYSEHYSPEAKELVEKYFTEELSLFNYSF
ncbi:MAG: hypothetical protein EA391_01660 [Balneolaceae bacterium]|nr:MAG: hypothetical protein EA391_01660 [Balneolaceae bacterium]